MVGASPRVTVYTDSSDVVQLINSKYPKPREKADITRITKMKRQMSRVHEQAVKSSWEHMATDCEKMRLVHIPGKENPADALTKAAEAHSFQILREILKRHGK